ncbi:transposase family protein [Streptomyces sp. NPDC006335]|uniref:transposase family protein n=1 Tax=Streptomyces sp. NPDC006335 TaxID=3156895 RepID=UPI0033B7960A
MAVRGSPGTLLGDHHGPYNKLVERLRAHELGAIGDLGFTGLDDDVDNPVVITGYTTVRTAPLTPAKKQVNKLMASVRAVCEHAFAHLKNWRINTKLRLLAPWRDHPAAGPARADQHRSHLLAVRRSWARKTTLDRHSTRLPTLTSSDDLRNRRCRLH